VTKYIIMLAFLSLITLVPILVSATIPRLPGIDLERLQDLRNQRQSQNLDLASDGALAPAAVAGVDLNTQFLDIPIDHFGTSPGTFKNRYWYNDTFYQSGGPVVVMDIGESNAEAFAENGFLLETDMRTAVMQIARRYKGIGVIWEHRYYGESVPFVDGKNVRTANDLSGDQFKYHTVEQALEDVVFFTSKFSTPKASNDKLKPANTPWIVVGGSYPGVRAALLRVRNPETIFASWASSAPVQAQVNMSSYWGAVERALPRNCSNDFVSMTSYVDSVLKGTDQTMKASLKSAIALTRAPGTTLTNAQALALPDSDVARIIMDPLSRWQNTGFNGAIGFCNELESLATTITPSADGVFANYQQIDAVKAFLFAMAKNTQSKQSKVTPGETPRPGPIMARQSAPVKSNFTPDFTSWTRQYCSEFGFFMGANPDNKRSIQTQLYTMDDVQQQCKQIFGSSIPSTPAVQNVLKFGDGWKMNPTRVMFTNGEFDPWKTLSVASTEFNSPQRQPNETIPGVDATLSDGNYFGTIYAGQVHAIDMAAFDGDKPERIASFDKGLSLFTSALDQWLPVFNSTNKQTATKDSAETKGTDKNAAATLKISTVGPTGLAILTFATLLLV